MILKSYCGAEWWFLNPNSSRFSRSFSFVVQDFIEDKSFRYLTEGVCVANHVFHVSLGLFIPDKFSPKPTTKGDFYF